MRSAHYQERCKFQVEAIYCSGKELFVSFPVEWDKLLTCLHFHHGWELLLKRRLNNQAIIRTFMAAEHNWGIYDNILLLIACQYGFAAVVAELMFSSTVNPACHQQAPLKIACRYGRAEIVYLLLKSRKVNPLASKRHLLVDAAKLAFFDVTRELLTCAEYTSADLEKAVHALVTYRGVPRSTCHIVETYVLLITDTRMNTFAQLARAISLHPRVVERKLIDPRIVDRLTSEQHGTCMQWVQQAKQAGR